MKNTKRAEGYYWVRLRANGTSSWGPPTVAEWEGGFWKTCGSEMDPDLNNVEVISGPLPMPLVDGLYWVQMFGPKAACPPEVAQYRKGRWYALGEEEPVDANLVHMLQGPIVLTGPLAQPIKPYRGSAT